MRMTRIEGFKSQAIAKWAKRHIQSGSHVVSDGLPCFHAFATDKIKHESIVTGGGPSCVKIEAFNWVNTMIGNVKNAIHGSYHTINGRHLPRYLAEFCYRFNRRFTLEDMIPRLAYVALRTPPMPQRLLSMAEPWGNQETLCLKGTSIGNTS